MELTLGEKIKKYRKEQGLTQQKLAEKSQISRSYLGDIEGNRYNPSLSTLKTIANSLNLDISMLVSDKSKYIKEPSKPRDLIKILEEEDYTLNGRMATPEDREKLKQIYEIMFWEAKAQNKRKK